MVQSQDATNDIPTNKIIDALVTLDRMLRTLKMKTMDIRKTPPTTTQKTKKLAQSREAINDTHTKIITAPLNSDRMRPEN